MSWGRRGGLIIWLLNNGWGKGAVLFAPLRSNDSLHLVSGSRKALYFFFTAVDVSVHALVEDYGRTVVQCRKLGLGADEAMQKYFSMGSI